MNDEHVEVLRVEGLNATFDLDEGPLHAVRDVSFTLHRSQILGIVGESGSGKSVTSRAIMRMMRSPGKVTSGRIMLGDRDLLEMPEKQARSIRGNEIAMIFQDPQSVLNPVMKILDQITEAMTIHGTDRKAADTRAMDLLEKVGIPEPEISARKYPHQFSGGMRQRVVLAIALANNPSILIADEPTTALDVTIQSQILELLRQLRDDLGIAIIFITHDMGVVAELCDDVAVMHQGEIIERGPVRQVLTAPQNDYTVGLMEAIPRMDDPLRASLDATSAPILEVRDLRVDVLADTRRWPRRHQPHFAVDGVSLAVAPGETLSLVGESGCGKSTLSRAVIGVNEATEGEIIVDGTLRTTTDKHAQRKFSRTIQYLFQDPYSSLNPRRTAGQSLEEALRIVGAPASELRDRCVELLERVSLDASHLDRYPHAFSGGQRQRIGIARALATQPRMLILDEPVSALDVSIQAQVMELFKQLQEELGLAYLFISHDLAVVREISHRVAVMQRGRIVETGTAEQVFEHPRHAYSQTLLSATPDLDAALNR